MLPIRNLKDLTVEELENNIRVYDAILPLLELTPIPSDKQDDTLGQWKESKRLMEIELMERILLQKEP